MIHLKRLAVGVSTLLGVMLVAFGLLQAATWVGESETAFMAIVAAVVLVCAYHLGQQMLD